MLRKVVIGAALLLLVLVVVACAGPASAPTSAVTPTPNSAQAAPTPVPTPTPAPKPSGPIKGTWIEPQVNSDAVSIPVSEIEKDWNVHFKVDLQGSTETFMAYLLDGKIYVRANICPPCRSIGYSLDKDVLICDRCGTRFNAKSGDGIDGACVNYPKAPVPYEITGSDVVMKKSDLLTAYQNTLEPGLP
jgi:nitrite reductase/ring-hydroxylating ferredoxin subunit